MTRNFADTPSESNKGTDFKRMVVRFSDDCRTNRQKAVARITTNSGANIQMVVDVAGSDFLRGPSVRILANGGVQSVYSHGYPINVPIQSIETLMLFRAQDDVIMGWSGTTSQADEGAGTEKE